MQFKITFQVLQPGQLLPLSYQYELSSWIYRSIEKSDSTFGEFLHTQGYYENGKRFKLFTFSNLYVPPKFEIIDDRMKIWSKEISFVVSFLVEKAAIQLITALFDYQAFRLGDRISQVDLRVKSVEHISISLETSDAYHLRAISPVLVAAPEMRSDGHLNHQYLSPLDEGFKTYFFKNLIAKYKAARAHDLVEDVDLNQPMQFQLLPSKIKKRGIRIKAQTPQETKVIGYQFDFALQAPRELVWVGLNGGFGGQNATGFGATRLLSQKSSL